MSDVRPTLSLPASGQHGSVPGVRPLTPAEVGHLDRARAHLRSSGADVDDPWAVGALLHSARTRWAEAPATPVPQAMVMALGVGVGDLIVARVPGARWALRIGSSPAPAVVSATGEDAALPLTDVSARWSTGCTPGWVAEYVVAAAAHLSAGPLTEVPTPRTPERGHDLVPETDGPDYLPSHPTVEGQPLSSRRPTPPLAARPVADQSIALRALADAAGAPRTPQPAPPAPVFSTPADLPVPPSPAAQDIALGALEQALEAALTGDVAPLGLVDGGVPGGHDVRRFDADASAHARAWVRASGAARAAVTWIGTLPDPSDPTSAGTLAVLVEASDAGAPSLVVAHRFSPAVPEGPGRARAARSLGGPLVLGQGTPLL
ncbi:DUF3806 domain-containing protein [Cellulomonas sp. ICMP 17802]|uniref:DUF3806 domain-containing protein n=1 Tax=Cellulomonas sp. ICMP 17802 TaxID=3239199 RepID=UPI00351BCE21